MGVFIKSIKFCFGCWLFFAINCQQSAPKIEQQMAEKTTEISTAKTPISPQNLVEKTVKKPKKYAPPAAWPDWKVKKEPLPIGDFTFETVLDSLGKPLDFVEIMPKFPDGESALLKFIAQNFKYPKEAIEKGFEGRIFLSFIVEKDGSLSHIKAIRQPDTLLANEAIRLLKTSPKWIPGQQNGEIVRVRINLPIGCMKPD
jgi:hypothetical protein